MFEGPERTAIELRELAPRDPLGVLASLRGDPYPWLLDSALPSPRIGRFSFAGADPYLVLRARGTRIELECRRAVRPGLALGRQVLFGDPLETVRGLLPPPPAVAAPEALPFLGGAVGYLGYELAERVEALALRGLDDLGLPELVLLFVDRLFAWDHVEERGFAVGVGFAADAAEARARGGDAADALCRQIEAPARRASDAHAARPLRTAVSCCDESSYAKLVDAVKQEVAAGNVYQACLTHRIERPCGADPWALYQTLRRINPAPFASYLELPEVAIVGSSPERFLRVGSDGRVESRPIKGTRPRGENATDDARLRRELEHSPKDRAENLMIVDLVRSDLGRVCETGSVEVPELMAIEAYASVFQMVSTVTGRLRDDRDAVDLLRAAFPPGSMTGAPKIAAMQLLARLESLRRGIYSGAIGYFDLRGGIDLCVVIRTILLHDGCAYLHTGGGIVADSDPGEEYRETLHKARPLLAALDDPDGVS